MGVNVLYYKEWSMERRPYIFHTVYDEDHFISKTFNNRTWEFLRASIAKDLERAKAVRRRVHDMGVDTTWDYDYRRDSLCGSIELRKLQRIPARWDGLTPASSATFEVEVIKWSIPAIGFIRDEEQLIHEINIDFKDFSVMLKDVDLATDNIGCLLAYYTFKKQNNYQRPDHIHLIDITQLNDIIEFYEYELWWGSHSIYGATIKHHRLDQYIKNVMDQENIFNSAVDLMCFLDEMRHIKD